jgi:hypothetical protein
MARRKPAIRWLVRRPGALSLACIDFVDILALQERKPFTNLEEGRIS